jgi:transcriptional regulator of acetoin/glycerol metabolism
MPLANEIAFDMLAVYFECMQNATIAARVYAVRYPQRRRYNKRVFVLLARRLRNTGSVHRPVLPRSGRGRNEENIINVLAYIEFNPHGNTRNISRELGISRTTVLRILTDHRCE